MFLVRPLLSPPKTFTHSHVLIPSGTCTLTLASLLDVGSIPAKIPFTRSEATERVLAKWRDVGFTVASLGKTCVLEASAVGWMAYEEEEGKEGFSEAGVGQGRLVAEGMWDVF